MLKDNWEEKQGINLPGQTTCAKGIQGTHVGNMILQRPQGYSDNDYPAGSSSRRNLTALAPSGSECSIPRQSNLQDGNSFFVLNGQPVSIGNRFDNKFHLQNYISETQPTFNANPCGNVIKKMGNANVSYNMVSQSQTMPVKPIDGVCSQTEAHKSSLPLKSYGTDGGKSLIGSNLQGLIKLLSTTHGLPMKMQQEMGSSEYLRLVEILQQSSVQSNGFSDTQSVETASLGPSVSTEQDEISRIMHSEGWFGNKPESIKGRNDEETPKLALADDELLICGDNTKEKIVGSGQKNDPILNILKVDEKKLPSGKVSRIVAEKLWDGSLQLSSSVTLSAVAFFKSGEKLLGNNWPEMIEVKGKVRLEAFEKYVQDLPRSRNRGLMVISLCWKEGSSDTGLTGMKEVAKGYKKSSRVGFAQLLSGIDLYICPRSDPIITILAKYGFFKGMAVIDDNQDSMIGCVVWRKNRPLNPVGDTSDGKTSSSPVKPQNSSSGLYINQGAEKNFIPEKLGLELGQHDEVEADLNGGNPSSNSVSSGPCNLVRKRPFEDDDLPEFDFGIVCGKSTLVSQPARGKSTLVSHLALGKSTLVSQPACEKSTLVSQPSCGKSTLVSEPLNPAIFRNNGLAPVNGQKQDNSSNGSFEPSSKKTKLFDDDDDDMPEWCPPELHNQIPPSNFKNLPSRPPPPPPIPPPPPPLPAGTRPSFSYQPFRPPISCPPPPPLPLPPRSNFSVGFSSNQDLRHGPSSNNNNNNINPSFQSSNGRRPRP